MMNQALGYIMLVAVGVLIAGPLMLYAASNVTSNAMSYQDFIELQNKRVAQNVVITHVQNEFNTSTLAGEIHIHITNTGLENISFSYILIDGKQIQPDTLNTKPCWDTSNTGIEIDGFCLYNATSGNPSNNLPPLSSKLTGMNPEEYLKDNPTEHHDLEIDSNIRLAIPYKKNMLTDPDPEVIQLVTYAFKLFEVSIPSP